MVRSPISTICSSSCFFTFATTSSILAGWILPSATSLFNARRQTSLLMGSKLEITMDSGVSSTTISAPVAASKALMFLPSLPMICPLISSESMVKTETVFSMVYSAAIR